MKILLFSFCLMLLTVNSYADRKEYYDPVNKIQVSNVKVDAVDADIKERFGLSDSYEVKIVTREENIRYKNGKVEIYNVDEDNKKIRDAEKVNKNKLIKKVKQEHGWTDQQWNDIKEALK